MFATQEPVLYLALISQLRNERLELDMEVSWTQGTAEHATAVAVATDALSHTLRN